MKIFIINPDYGVTPEQLATRCRLLSAHVGPDVELTMECLTQNKIEIDSALDVALAAPEIITMALRAQNEGYDAVVIYCFSDPALDACRELLSIPVVGAGQAACLVAPLVGRQAGLLLASALRAPEKRLFVEQCGVNPARIAAIGGLGEAVCSCLSEKCPTPVKRIGVNDEFGHSGPAKDLLKQFGLSAENIVKVTTEFVK